MTAKVGKGLAIVLAVVACRSTPDAPAIPTPLVLAPSRSLEARVAWQNAASYRPYDVPRAAQAVHEQVPLAALADFERAGDLHGVGVLALLDGDRRQAASYLDRAGDAADVIADRAALALADGHPDRALALGDDAIAKTPGHAVAVWNRALALRDLGLSRGAANAFRDVAKLHEPGWADEATHKADALDADADARQHRFERISAASVALAGGQLTLTVDDARAEPGFARGILYDGIRSATTKEKLAELAPLAKVIDEADHDTALTDALARAAANLHPELSQQYGEMVRALAVDQGYAKATGDEKPLPAGPARAKFLQALRAAHADDLLIGVLMKLGDDRINLNADEAAEFGKLTAASPDPWMQVLGPQLRAQLALSRDDLIGAEALLLQAKQLCMRGAPAFRCIGVRRLLGHLYLAWQRLPEARAALTAAWGQAHAAGEWFLEITLLPELARLSSLGDDAEARGLPLIRAYTDENVLRMPPDPPEYRCTNALWGRALRAMDLIDRLDFDGARSQLVGQACGDLAHPDEAALNIFVRSELVQSDAELARLRADIAKLRASPTTVAANQVWLDHSEGRALIDRDPAAAEALLRHAIAEASKIPPSVLLAHRYAAWSYSVLATSFAKHGRGDDMLALLAEEQDLTLASRCVLGVAIEDQRRAVVARDDHGKTIVHYDETRTAPEIDAATLVPADIVGALAACPSVDVIARPPIHGRARLLGDAIAWRYLSRRSGPVGPSGDRRVVVADVEPPLALELPRLATWTSEGEVISGPAATPARVLAAIGAAGDVVIHAHGIVDAAEPGASYLALSPDSDGMFALTAAEVRRAHFTRSPLIVLAACEASHAAPLLHETWSLPAAFVYAGAGAVFASAAPIPDADAAAFFDAIRTKVIAGASPTIALRDARRYWLDHHRGDWVRDVIVFE